MASPLGLPATSYVVLGLVSIRPMTGYDLVSYAERSVGNFFALTRSHIYRELGRLGRLGLLDATEVAQETAPTKRVYEISPAGTRELRRWLEEDPVAEERTRDLFLVRIFFGHRTSPARIEALLTEYETAARDRRDRLAAIAERLADRPGSVFRRSTARYGVHQEQAKLAWVTEVRPILLAAAAAAELTSGGTGCSVH